MLDPAVASLPVVPLARELAGAGVRLMQLRDKRSSAAQIHATARELASMLFQAGVTFILNDRPDIAAILSVGVHVGQEDLPIEAARRICGQGAWVGVSTHHLDQLRLADATSADYIGVGPIFPTGTKENPDPVVGIDFLRQARELTRKPLVAIGGITLDSAGDVFRAGADSVAVIRDLIADQNPARRAREYIALAEKTRTSRD